MRGMLIAFRAILWREVMRFLGQRSRFFAALVRPLVWLFIFAAGFRAALGLSITPPYQTYITYDVYVVPGLLGMILLFNGMQSALSLVNDRESGAMLLLLSSPQPRWWLLTSKLVAGTCISLLQSFAFIAIALLYGIRLPYAGLILLIPALFLSGLMLGMLGLALSAHFRQMENFAGVMNFVIFPMFFLSSALYPLWKLKEGSPVLAKVASFNPFTHAVELIRFALYGRISLISLMVVMVCIGIFGGIALTGFDPSRGSRQPRKGNTFRHVQRSNIGS